MIKTVKKIRIESRDPCVRFWHQVRVASAGAALIVIFGGFAHVIW